MNTALIIPAAGVGKRFSKDQKKQFIEIDGKPLIYWTIKRLLDAYKFSELVVGLNSDDKPFMENIIKDMNISIPVIFAKGGSERVHTVINCLEQSKGVFVAVHDSVRPFVSDKTICDTINYAFKTKACICALPVRDTVKKVSNNIIINTVPRDNLYLAHTPQVFERELLLKALKDAVNKNITVTDEASACEIAGIKTAVVVSNYENIKVTYLEDLEVVNLFKNKFFKKG